MRNNSLVIVVDEVLRKISKGEERERGGGRKRDAVRSYYLTDLCVYKFVQRLW